MPRRPDAVRRAELLDAVIEAMAGGGIGGRSLRDIAAAVGTSHRMLLHHFGTREDLLLAVVDEIERRQASTLQRLPEEPLAAVAAMWADLRRPELRPLERLFFECYARGAQGEEPFRRLPAPAVEGWLEQVSAHSGLGGGDPELARLGLAVTRGLLLDLVATGDEQAVDAAHARFIDLLRAYWDHGGRADRRRHF